MVACGEEIIKSKGYERQMEALQEPVALHDVPETKGVNVLGSKYPSPLSHSDTKS
jgi:hypothetical protein